MIYIKKMLFFLSHLDKYINVLVASLGYRAYLVIFLNFVLETGGLILGFLPGDSLVIAASAYSAVNPEKLNIFILYLVILLGTMIGDSMSFHFGKFFGKKYLGKKKFKFITEEQFDKVHNFFNKNGKKSFIINRFIPFARAWLPFVAGFTGVGYQTIMHYNLFGCFFWTTTYTLIGYFFGNRRFIRRNFSFALLVGFIISMIPATIIILRNRQKIKNAIDKKISSNNSLNSKDIQLDDNLSESKDSSFLIESDPKEIDCENIEEKKSDSSNVGETN